MEEYCVIDNERCKRYIYKHENGSLWLHDWNEEECVATDICLDNVIKILKENNLL